MNTALSTVLGKRTTLMHTKIHTREMNDKYTNNHVG